MYDQVAKIIGSIGNVVASVTSRGTKGALAVEIVDTSGNPFTQFVNGGLVTAAYDYVAVTSSDASGNPLVVQYKSGGASGTLVATLTMTYDASSNLLSVTKT